MLRDDKIIRKPVVAGQFYPGSKTVLTEQIKSFLKGKNLKKEHKAKALVLPHAGYIFSGQVAIETIVSFELADTLVIMGPNHTGLGNPFSLPEEGLWLTPLGQVEVEQEFLSSLLNNSKYITKDSRAHKYEHSIEVQLPLLQYVKGDFKIVPIIVSPADKKAYEDIGSDIAKTAKELNKKVTIIASTDFTHYEPQKTAQEKDKAAIEAILELNTSKLNENLKKLNISMCGYAPTSVMIEAVKKMGAEKGKLIKYQTSGDVTGDYLSVVGYAGIGFY